MQMYINYCCISMKQTEGLGSGANEMHCHIIHMDMLHLSLLPTLAISLPGMKYTLTAAAAHTAQTVTAETMPGANYVTDDIHMKT